MQKEEIIKGLNEALEHEYAAIIQFSTHAAMAEGLDADPVIDALREMARGELGHVEKLLQRIWALGGRPSTKPAEVRFERDLSAILDADIKKEKEAIAVYTKLLNKIPRQEGSVLYETVEDLRADEEMDFERLTRLKGMSKKSKK